jgi:hypothetical protein
MFCGTKFQARLGETSNIKKHLDKHEEISKWMHLFDDQNKAQY